MKPQRFREVGPSRPTPPPGPLLRGSLVFSVRTRIPYALYTTPYKSPYLGPCLAGSQPVGLESQMADRWRLVFSVFGYGLDADEALSWALNQIAQDPDRVLEEAVEYVRAEREDAEAALSEVLLPYLIEGEA